MGGDFTAGGIALCASTRKLLLDHSNNHASYPMLVLEDDAQLASGINATTVRALLEYLGRPDGGSHPTNWDILLLGTHPESIILPEEVGAVPRALGGPLLRVGDPFFGLFAYIVRDGAAAKRIVDRVFPCDVQLDSAISDAASEGALNVLHVASPLFTSPKSMPGETDIQRMDEDSFVSMQKVKLVEQGQIDAVAANHPGVVKQIRDAYRRSFGS